MLNKFRFDEAERALTFVLNREPTGIIDDKLDEAKKVYDFLTGSSHHFQENDETKSC